MKKAESCSRKKGASDILPKRGIEVLSAVLSAPAFPPRRARILKKSFAAFLSIVYLHAAVTGFGQYAWASLPEMFGAGSPRKGDRDRAGQYGPEQLREYMDYKERLANSMTERERMLDPQKSKVLDKIENNVNKNVQEALQNADHLARQAQEARNKVFAVLGQNSEFNYVKYDDGKMIYMKDGLANRILNERIIDLNGNVSLRDTVNFLYNEKRLMTSYDASTLDALGNVTKLKWTGGTYAADAVHYATEETQANRNITGYVQETTDIHGNVTKLTWSGASYDGKLLAGYHQVTVDARGHAVTKDWFGAQYDANGQIKAFTEVESDDLGNTKTRRWSGGTYVKNHAYRQDLADQGVAQDASEYLLVSYQEEIIEDGLTTRRDWGGASYDKNGQLARYRELTTDPLGRESLIEWREGKYDNYGRLTSYVQDSTDIAGASTQIRWQAVGYENNHRLTGFQERRTDALGMTTFTTRRDMLYSRLGDVLQYSEETLDARGNTSTRDWAATSLDSYGRVTAYEEDATDPAGVRSLRVWKDAVYDRKGRLLANREETTDEMGGLTVKIWEDAAYDRYGRLQAYRQTDISPQGDQTSKEWTATAFDDMDRVLTYEQTMTDADGNVTSSVWRAGTSDDLMAALGQNPPALDTASAYTLSGQVVGFLEELTDMYGQVSRRLWQGARYNAWGDVIFYDEILQDPAGEATTHTWQDGVYDGLGRLISCNENWSVVEPDGSRRSLQDRDWQALSYDRYGRALEVLEAIRTASGQVYNTREYNVVYNARHQKVSYETESVGPDGSVHLTRRENVVYNARGRVQSYVETVVSDADPAVETRTEVSGRAYDRFGKITQGQETVCVRGTDSQGRAVDTTRTTVTSNPVLQNGALTSYQQTTTFSGTGLGGETLDSQEILTISAITPFSEIQTLRRIAPLTPTVNLDHTTVINRSNIVRDFMGQIVGYTDVIMDEATPAKVTTVVRSQTVFGGRGDVLGYREVTTDNVGLYMEKVLSHMIYDGQSRLTRFQETSIRRSNGTKSLAADWDTLPASEQIQALREQLTDFGSRDSWDDFSPAQKADFLAGRLITLSDGTTLTFDSAAKKIAVHLVVEEFSERTATDYDALGRMTRSVDEVDSSADDIVRTRTWRAGAFNGAGLVTEDEFVASFSGLARPYEVTTTRAGVEYNRYGQILALTETTTDDRTDVVVTREAAGMTYDSYGALKEMDEKTTTAGTATRELPDHDEIHPDMLTGAKLLFAGHEVDWDTLSASDRNALLAGQELTITTPGGPVILSLQRARATVMKIRLDLTTRTVRHTPTLDSDGRLVGFVEDIRTFGPGLDRTETRTRLNMAYDSLYGRLTGYMDIITATDTPDLTTIVERSDMEYDPFLDQLSGYKETILLSDASGPLKDLEVDRRGISYDTQGRVLGYSETQQGTGILGVRRVSRTGVIYNELGRLEEYKERVRDAGGYSTLTEVTGIAYNDLGQEIGQVEDVHVTAPADAHSNGLNLRVRRERKDVVYNEVGQKTFSIETETRSDAEDLAVQTVFSGGVYNTLGQLVSYRERTHSTDTDGPLGLELDLTLDTTRVSTAYNGLGQVVSLEEDVWRSDAEAVSMNRRQTAMLYTREGHLETFLETTEDVARDGSGNITLEVQTERERLSTIFDPIGLPTEFRERVHKTGTSTSEDLDIESETIRSNITYTKGRLQASYEDSVTSDEFPGVTRQALWTGYYDNSHLAASTQTEDDGRSTTELERSGIRYNGLGQADLYSDSTRRTAPATALAAALNVTSENQRFDIVYDDQGRLRDYKETRRSSDRPDAHVLAVWSGGAYNDRGQLESFSEETLTQSLDANGQPIMGFGGNLQLDQLEIRTRTFTDYNSLGRVVETEDVVEDTQKGTLLTTNRYDIFHDGQGFEVAFFEETYLQDAAGLGDLDVFTLTARLDTVYETDRRAVKAKEEIRLSSTAPDMLDYTDTVILNDALGRAVTVSEYRNFLADDGAGLYLDKEIYTDRTDILYDSQGRQIGFMEDLVSSDAPDMLVETTRSAGAYNRLGQVTGYQEVSRRSSLSDPLDFDVTLATTRSDTTYDKLGQERSYKEVSTSNAQPGIAFTREWSNGAYDLGLLKTFTEKTTRADAGNTYNVQATVTRESTEYDIDGREISTVEKTVSNDAPDVTRRDETRAIVYDGAGRRDAFTRISGRTSADSRLDETMVTGRLFTVYDLAGREIEFKEESVSDASPDLVTTLHRDNIVLNDLAQMTSYRDHRTQVGEDASGGIILDVDETIERATIAYDALGRQQAFAELVTSNARGNSFRLWQAQAFTAFGEAAQYTETGPPGPTGDPIFSRTWQGTFDNRGRVKSFQETEDTDAQGLTSRNRTNITYDGKGQLASYSETGVTVDMPSYNKTWQADPMDGYTAAGRENHYVETVTTDLGLTRVTEWRNPVYNAIGRLSSFEDVVTETKAGVVNQSAARAWQEREHTLEGWTSELRENTTRLLNNPATGALVYTETGQRDWEASGFTATGQPAGYTESVTQTVRDAASTVVQQVNHNTTRSGVTYDTLGRMDAYDETGTRNGSQFQRSWDAAGFNNRGRAAGYTESGYSQDGGPFDLTRAGIEYDDHGFILKYDETGWSGGKPVDRQWGYIAGTSGYDALPVYDAVGRLYTWSEKGTGENGDYIKKQTAAVYDPLSRLTSTAEAGWSASEGNYEKTLSNITYDTNGRRATYNSVSKELDRARRTETLWAAVSYSAAGQLAKFTDVGKVYENNVHVDDTDTAWQADFADSYTAQGLLDHFKSVSTLVSVATGADRRTTQERSHHQYDSNGRILGYRESIILRNEAGGVVKETESNSVQSGRVYYTASDETADAEHKKYMLAGYRELTLGTGAAEKPFQRVKEGIRYDSLGRELKYVDVSADEDLTAGALRRLEKVLNAPASVTSQWIIDSLELAGLLDLSLGLAASLVTWVDTALGLSTAQETDLANLLLELRALYTQPASALALLHQNLLTLLAGGLAGVPAALSAAVGAAFPGQTAPVFPLDAPLSSAVTAYQALHPFDYNATVTHRTSTALDSLNRPVSWTETTFVTDAPGKWSNSSVAVTYQSDSARFATYAARIHETDGLAGTVNKVTNLFRTDFVYDSLGQSSAYKEMMFENDALRIDGANVDWSALTNAQRAARLAAILAETQEVREPVTINVYSNVHYNPAGQMTDYDLETHKRGFTFQSFSEAAGIAESLTRQADMIAKQEASITQAEAAVAAAELAWDAAYNEAKTVFGNDLPACDSDCDTTAERLAHRNSVIDEVSSRFKAKLTQEGNAEIDYEAAREVLGAKLAVLAEKSRLLQEAVAALAVAQSNWNDSVALVTGFLNGLNTTTIGTEVSTLQTYLDNYMTVSEGRAAKKTDLSDAWTRIQSIKANWATTSIGTVNAVTTAVNNLSADWSTFSSVTEALKTSLTARITELTADRDAKKTTRDALYNELSGPGGLEEQIATAAGAMGVQQSAYNADNSARATAQTNYDNKNGQIAGVNSTLTAMRNQDSGQVINFSARNRSRTCFAWICGSWSYSDWRNYVVTISGDSLYAQPGTRALDAGGQWWIYTNGGFIDDTWLANIQRAIAHEDANASDQSNDNLNGLTFIGSVFYGGTYTRPAVFKAKIAERNNLQTEANALLVTLNSRKTTLYGSDMVSECSGDFTACGRAYTGSSTTEGTEGRYLKAIRDHDLLVLSAYGNDRTKESTAATASGGKHGQWGAAYVTWQNAETALTNAVNAKTWADARALNYADKAAQTLTRKNDIGVKGTALTTATTNRNNALAARDAAQAEVDTARAVFNAKAVTLETKRQARDTAERALGAVARQAAARDRADDDLAVEQANKTRIVNDRNRMRTENAAHLDAYTFLVAGQTYNLTSAEAALLVENMNNTVLLGGQSYTLAQLGANGQIKVSASAVSTSARRSMTYDGRGFLAAYKEVSFNGTELTVGGNVIAWKNLTEIQKVNIFNTTLTPEILGAGSFALTEALSHTYDARGRLLGQKLRTTETRPASASGGQAETQVVETEYSDMTYDSHGRMATYEKETDTTFNGVTKNSVERTLSAFAYDARGRVMQSDLEIVDTLPSVTRTLQIKTNGMVVGSPGTELEFAL